MRVALVNPIARRSEGYHTAGEVLPQLGLQVLAHLTPPEHTVEIIDEAFGTEDTGRVLRPDRYDLVGVTAYTSSAPRAYEVATMCRERGIPCIMGGTHAWAMPEEAARYFDSVAVGECDDLWPGILADAAAGRLQARYDGRLADLSAGHGGAAQGHQPINGRYTRACIQTSRGCPIGCDFCSVTRFCGPRIRRRPIADIVDEWNRMDCDQVFVVDDNFFGIGPDQVEWSRELLRTLLRHGKRRYWFSQTSVNIGSEVETLRLAYKAGCRGMLVGLESFNEGNLKSFKKGVNRNLLSNYRGLVDGFHRAGLAVFGCLIIGGDEDTEDTVAETALRAVQLGVDIIQITNLTPLPGTEMYERWMEEGRIFATNYPEDWERYSFTETVYNPRRMTAAQLDERIHELRLAAAELPWVWKRTVHALLRTRSPTTAAFVHSANKGWARLARQQMVRDAASFDDVVSTDGRADKLRKAFSLFPGRV